MRYPQRLLLSLETEQLAALEQIAAEFARAGYATNARGMAQDLLGELLERPDVLTILLRQIAQREEVVLRQDR